WFTGIPALVWLAGRIAVLGWRKASRIALGVRLAVLAFLLALLGAAAYDEMNSSYLESLLFSHLDQAMAATVEPGPSPSLDFPSKSSPYDERLGYAELPDFTASLTQGRFAVDSQARWSQGLARFAKLGAFPLYPEKDQAGLRIFDRNA